MFNIFKNKKKKLQSATSDSNNVNFATPSLVIHYWKNYNKYYDPFDEEIYNKKSNADSGRLEFAIFFGSEYILLGNIEVHAERSLFYITGVNTHEYCRKKGVTNLLFSWVILKLMLVNENNDFDISIKIGVNVQNIRSETGRFIYDRVFNTNNNVYISSEIASRRFLLSNRGEDYDYFKKLYDQVSESIINEYVKIKEDFVKYYN